MQSLEQIETLDGKLSFMLDSINKRFDSQDNDLKAISNKLSLHETEISTLQRQNSLHHQQLSIPKKKT